LTAPGPSPFFNANKAQLGFGQTIPSGRIAATTPEGVAELEIVYEVRTGSDV